MEDLIPLLIFIVIAAVNLIKFIAEKSAKSAPPKSRPDQPKPARSPSSIEEFFEEIAQRLGPAPRKMPDWPEEVERPDYVGEMEAFKAGEPVRKPEPAPFVPALSELPPVKAIREVPGVPKTFTLKMAPQNKALSGMSGLRIASPPLLRSAGGKTRFDLKTRAQLKQALIASMIFGPPRAYDTSFDNTKI
jgi:hypothetical protein